MALSFRLWGDPELRPLSALPGQPALPPVTAHWTADYALAVHFPAKRLPQVRNARYAVWMFPGSQPGGECNYVFYNVGSTWFNVWVNSENNNTWDDQNPYTFTFTFTEGCPSSCNAYVCGQ